MKDMKSMKGRATKRLRQNANFGPKIRQSETTTGKIGLRRVPERPLIGSISLFMSFMLFMVRFRPAAAGNPPSVRIPWTPKIESSDPSIGYWRPGRRPGSTPWAQHRKGNKII
jgi:hypothetical protein